MQRPIAEQDCENKGEQLVQSTQTFIFILILNPLYLTEHYLSTDAKIAFQKRRSEGNTVRSQ